MEFHTLAAVSAAVASESARTRKRRLLADAVARLDPGEVPAGVAMLAGELRQPRTGIGWVSAGSVQAEPADTGSLTILDVDRELDSIAVIAGAGARARRGERLQALLERMTGPEQRYLRGLLSGGLRQGALRALVADAVADAAAVPAPLMRRAVMLTGDLGVAAGIALGEGRSGLESVTLRVGTPLQPMLASPAADPESAIEGLHDAFADWKLDGVRIQAHCDGELVRVFTRGLEDVTDRVPRVMDVVRALPARTCVLDGEVIALRRDGRPEPFQVSAAMIAAHETGPDAVLHPFFFDLLHLDGTDMFDAPARDRIGALERLVPPESRVRRSAVADARDVSAFMAEALAAGHEGIIVKDGSAPYAAGRRGSAWRKLKPVHTLDLVVLAAEWGSGRRRGRLSNLHLGARDPGGGFVMLGKTFKGLTDDMLAWQTEQLLARELRRDRHVVMVRPELVVEIAFDGVQDSPRYPGGVALRFARVVRYRPDRDAAQADTIDTVRGFRQNDAAGGGTS